MTDGMRSSKPIAGGRGHMQGMVRKPPAADHFSPGGAVGDSNLSTAVEELHGQHPQKYDDLGPHHADKKR